MMSGSLKSEKKSSSTTILDENQVLELLTWNEVYDAVETAMASVSNETGIQSARSTTDNLLQKDSLLLTMPGCLKDEKFGALACKLLTIFPSNFELTDKTIPIINSTITLFDEKTGILKALISSNEITKWRTAAASVVATKYVTPGKELKIAAILGAGAQGRIHAMAFKHFFGLSEIRIWNRTPESAHKLVNDMNQTLENGIFKYYQCNEKCVRGADVIITTTNSDKPIVALEWLKEGVHINAVGYNPSAPPELAMPVYLSSDVYIDHWAGAKKELAHLEANGVKFKGEIGELIYGKLKASPKSRITVFDSLGMAVEDCAVARMVYDKYISLQTFD